MKELTIEQKAKAYDEAFRIAQELYNDPNSSNVGKGYVCTVFPEVKESEDERIRKELINYFIKGREYLSLCSFSKEEILAWLEKQDEQKPTDKIEPKFKVGYWITNGTANPAQISSIKDGMYFTHNDTIGGDIESIDKEYHLWTIKDAKDGDVLAFNDNIIVMFKDLYDKSIFHSYCYIEDDVFSISQDDMPDCWIEKGFHPATKEQRELLFQKMKEAGYEWDAEKKELKKQEIAEIPFGAKDSELQEATYYIPKGFHAEIDGNKVVIKKGNQKPIEWSEDEKIRKEIANYFKHYSGGDNISIEFPKWIAWLEKQAEQKSAWSEEDTETLNGIVNYLFTSTDVSSIEGSDKWYDWLKSLKNRVIPKQEWSEEDENMLKTIFDSLNTYAKNSYPCLKSVVKEEINWLKSLRPQKPHVYNPYKAVVESIAKMCDKYKSRMCDEKEAKDFLANVAVKCREAAEYNKNYSQ